MPISDNSSTDSLDAQLASLRAKSDSLEHSIQTAKTSTQHQTTPTWWTNTDAMTVSALVLAFGTFVVIVAAYLIRSERDGQVVLKVLATILIITFAVFLIVAGWSDQQIAPAMGLLGTIAGYILGKEHTERLKKADEST